MKKLNNKKVAIAISAIVFIILSVLFLVIFNQEEAEEDERTVYTYLDFEYIILDNGKLEITAYHGSDEYVDIPDAISSRSVYSIGEGAFASSTLIRSVEIGSFTKEIKDRAFLNCIELETVKFNRGLLSIGEYSFF